MDKTKLENKIIFRYKQKRGVNPGVGSDDLLSDIDVHKISDQIQELIAIFA